MKYAKVKENPALVRDMDSMAILNTDKNSLNKYKEEREYKLKLAKVVSEHEQIKQDLTDIKSMLAALLNRDNK